METEDHVQCEDTLIPPAISLPAITSGHLTSAVPADADTMLAPTLETQGTILDVIENRQRALLQKRKSQEQLYFLLFHSPAQKLLKRSNTIGQEYFPKLTTRKETVKESSDRWSSREVDHVSITSVNSSRCTPPLASRLQAKNSHCYTIQRY